MTDTAAVPEPIEERWTYAGVRLDEKGKPHNVWIPDGSDRELWYPPKGIYTVASVYAAMVTRTDDGRTTLHGTPKYVRRLEDRDKIVRLEAEHWAAKADQERLKRERSAATEEALDDALAPLVRIARMQRTRAQRDAFAARVMRKLMGEW
jgi:hypothetical protein